MTDGRTVWWAKDSLWWERERITALGEEFGADGPAVIDWLSGRAKLQNEGGMVKAGYRSVSRGCFVKVERVREVLSRSVTLGSLEDFESVGEIFTCRISGWKADQERVAAAIRQARARSSKPDDGPMSRSVTASHKKSLTEEKRTEEEPTPLTPLPGGDEADRLWQRTITALPESVDGRGRAMLAQVDAVAFSDDTLTLRTDAGGWLRDRFLPLLVEAASKVAGRSVAVEVASSDGELHERAKDVRRTRRAERALEAEGARP